MNLSRAGRQAWMALALWTGASLAQPPDYDAFSDREGNIATERQHEAAIALVRDPAALEAVYADATKGDARARRVWRALEANFSGAGVEVAERSTSPGCLVPGYRELSRSCLPDWSFLDFLARDKPGAAQLRKVIFDAFTVRARERGLQNQAILSAINGLVAVGVATAALREAGAVARAATLPETAKNALKAAGQAEDRGGLTKAGRALAKHGGREGSVFPRPAGNPASINQQGQAALEDILGNVSKTSPNKFGGLDYFGGRRGGGARFDA